MNFRSYSEIVGIVRNKLEFHSLKVFYRVFNRTLFHKLAAMPKVKRSRKPPPEGWELIEPTLDELDQKMREGIYNFVD